MPVRIKLPIKTASHRRTTPGKTAANFSRYAFYTAVSLLAIAFGYVIFSYLRLANIADEKLVRGPFPNSSVLLASPESVSVGDPGSPAQFASRLRESGYQEDAHANPTGWYHLRADAIEIFPGDRSYSNAEPGVIRCSDGKIIEIIALSDNSQRTEYTLEPALLSTLFDKSREKRRLVKFEDIPPLLVHAVVSIEDKRFFQHSGFDPIRITKAIFVDLRSGRKSQGASTLTQQLAKNLWLDPGKTFQRKYDELLITLHLEHRLTKQKIFEYYANQVDLGRRGTFAIRGFGEASQAYFGKSIANLTLPEAATLAGLIQEPSRRNPVKWPDRAKTRRNVVLRQMLDNGYISQSDYEQGIIAPLVTTRGGSESTDAPYFVDMVNDRLADKFDEENFQQAGAKIYTTLDTELQRDATEAVGAGLKEVDAILAKRQGGGGPDLPQVALLCLDPHTGEVKAFVGGRNYAASQLDHAVSHRPAGSAFKPIVYAAALNSGLYDQPNAVTVSTLFSDTPQTFNFGGQDYAPTDYHKDDWKGDVTVRTAFIKSLNVPAIEVAQRAGYRTVADLAHKVGLADVHATPSMALGTYDVTPLDMAGAYTTFANDGVFVKPQFISRIIDKTGHEMWNNGQPQTKRVLDSRVNYLVVSLMQDVLRYGTGAGVRARGFALPAAGKTGTSHDAWFAGFTSKLLCVVWVGLDDYQDIKMDGAKAALPIWTAFMKRAHQHRAYRDATDFAIPDGVVMAQIDTATGSLATSSCPQEDVKNEYYLVGTQPVQFCAIHSGSQFATWDSLPSAPPPNSSNGGLRPVGLPPPDMTADGSTQTQNAKEVKEKKGILDKLKSIFH